ASNLAADTVYTFAVAALDTAGSSAESSPIAVHTAAAPPPPVVPPDHGAAPGSAGRIYPAGKTARGGSGATYKAKLWAQSTDPAHNNGGAGTGAPWSIVAGVDPSHEPPTVPMGLAAEGTSSSAFSVIDRYHVHSLDFDIEGAAAQDQHSITLRD